jgi:RNA polymerase sigma-70 factor (ECF subfamily)
MLSQTATHATLLARLADSHDPAAWAEFHQRYAGLVRSFCRIRGLQASDCDDVLQDVMLALSKAMPGFRYDPAKGKFRSYLKTVVMHAISKKACQNNPARRLSDIGSQALPADDDSEAQWEGQWRQYHLRRALAVVESEFSQQDRLVFERYGLAGEEAQGVARAMGMSVDQVYQAKSRIARRIGELVRAQVEEEG